MSPLSIVHLTTYLQGGAGRAITELACAQRAAGHHVLVMSSTTAVAGYGNYQHYLERLHCERVELILEDSLFTRDATLNRRALDRLMAARPPGSVDILHAHAGTPGRIGLRYARESGGIVLQTQHGWGMNKTPDQAAQDLEILDAVGFVVTTSDATRTHLVGLGLDSTRAVTIPCGIPSSIDEAARAEATSVLSGVRAKADRVVGCVGSVTPNKNQHGLLEALSVISNVVGVFIGEGGDQLVSTAARLGVQDRVVALGYRPDADAWMPSFDLLVVPSFSEGQGLVVLEAFRAGVPVACSDIASLRQLVTDGKTGWLFDPHDARDMARVIQHALAVSPRDRAPVTERARTFFLAGYTVEQMVQRHDHLYQQLRAA
jgi:glycosyltransferase involved in cell wall biosynthesis